MYSLFANAMPKVLIIEPDPLIASQISGVLERFGLNRGVKVTEFSAVDEGDCHIIALKKQDDSLSEGSADRVFVNPLRIGDLLSYIQDYLQVEPLQKMVGPFYLKTSTCMLVHRSGHPSIVLTEKERDILSFLADRVDTYTPREVLLRDVWAYNEHVESHTLETHIYRLRQKIEKDPANPEILRTEQGGYGLFKSNP